MKRLLKQLSILCVMLALVLSACAPTGGETKEVVVTALQSSVQLKDTEVVGYNYTPLFSVTEDGEPVPVLPAYIDASRVSSAAGTYKVTCTYQQKSASLDVVVVAAVRALSLSVDEVTVKVSEVQTYDFLALFSATLDGEPAPLTADMATSTVKAEAGDYTYTVDFFGESKTLTVHVIPDHTVEIVLSYREYSLPVGEKADFDPTVLFSVYADGEAVRVTEGMVDASALAAAGVGDTVSVTCSYTLAGTAATGTAAATVRIVSDRELTIVARDAITYPNAAALDLSSLFTITYDGKNIPVTLDMIEGTVDYTKEGTSDIVLSYGGKTATAHVTVKFGVVINYAKSDTVTVREGTDMRTYPFADDFIVVVNGTRFRDIPDSYFILGETDFSHEGTYEVTLKVPYVNERDSAIKNATPVYSELTITYVVSTVNYSLRVRQDVVELAAGTTEYNPFNNVVLFVDGVMKTLTSNPAYLGDETVVYAVLRSGEVDLTDFSDQTVVVDVYVFGPDEEPETVSFTVRVKSDVTVSAVDRVAFTGATLYTRDLFHIRNGREELPVSLGTIEGKVDTFTPGVYTVTIEYLGMTATSRVVIYPADMVGTYKTRLRTIPVEEEDYDDEDYGDWGYGDDYRGDDSDIDAYAASPIAATPTTPLGDLIITTNGDITVNGDKVYSVTGIDEHTMQIKTRSENGNDFMLYYEDGIVIVNPVNKLRMQFSDYMRPLIYFQENLWTINEVFVINYGAQHVLETEYEGYSFNIFRITSKTDGAEKWYALYIRLISKTSGDTDYEVKWGEGTFENFSHEIGSVGAFLFDGTRYSYTLEENSTAKVVRNGNSPYAGHRFNGTIDGEVAAINCQTSDRYTLVIGKTTYELYGSDIAAMKNGGALAGDILFLYNPTADEELPAFSYKFRLDLENNTFELLERDVYVGVYRRGDLSLYFDGYGTGEFNVAGSYMRVPFTYEVRSGEAHVVFHSEDPKFAYGTEADFYISPLLNVLTVKSSAGLDGGPFVIDEILDGAIVSFTATTIGGTGTMSSKALEDSIAVRTKDGIFTGSECRTKNKCPYVETECVNFGNQVGAHFCRVTVTVLVGGQKVTSEFAIQALGDALNGSPYVGTWGGAISRDINITFESSGKATISAGGATYVGIATVYDSGFVIKAYNASGSLLTADVTVLDERGVAFVKFSGALNSADYFSKGSAMQRAGGADGNLLDFTVSGAHIYVFAETMSDCGEAVEVEIVGTTYTVTFADGTSRTANVVFGDTQTGFTFTDEA